VIPETFAIGSISAAYELYEHVLLTAEDVSATSWIGCTQVPVRWGRIGPHHVCATGLLLAL
jgi:hypothetical protein